MTVPLDIEIVQGQTWTQLFVVTGLTSSGYGQRLHIRDHHGATLLRAALTHDGATNARVSLTSGGILANLGATVSTAWDLQGQPVRRWVYSVEHYSLSDPDDVTVTHAGTALVKSNPTDESSITPVTPWPSYDLVAVRFDLVQSLTTEQKARARANIGVSEGGGATVHADLTGRSADDAHPQSAITGLVAALAAKAASDHTHADATGSAAGFMPAASVTKLAGIATGATANATDADLRARSSHTGTQLAATISDFTSAASAAAPVQTVAGRTGAVVIAVADVSGAESTANKAQANGYASLDSSGKVPQAQLPAIAISEYLGDVASQAAMLALSGQKGDWCTRSDSPGTWIITGTDPTLLGSWTSIVHPTDSVTSVAGRTGAVTLSATDITDSTSAGRAVMTAANAAAIRTAAGVVIGTDVQGYSAALAGTTASFTTAQETKLSGIETLADVTDAGNVGSAIDGATAKTTPVDADTVALIDSAAGNVLKKLSWANIKATLKTYFDAIYVTIGGALGTPTSGTLTNCTGYPAASTAASGIVELAIASEVDTGTDATRAMTPDSYRDSTPYYTDRTADWTLAQADANTEQQFNSGTAKVCTIDTNANAAISVGTVVPFLRLGSGSATIDAVAGVTLNGVDGASKVISTQYQGALLRKVGTNAWVISGDIA